MTDYRAKARAELGLIEETLSLLDRTLQRPTMEQAEWMAVAGFVYNVFTGIANVLKLLCRAKGAQVPADSPTSHRDLLDTALAHDIIRNELRDALDEYRAFRHFFAHSYGVMLDPDQLGPLARRLPAVWIELRSRVSASISESNCQG